VLEGTTAVGVLVEQFSKISEIPPDQANDLVHGEGFQLVAALLTSLSDGAVDAKEDTPWIQWDEELKGFDQVVGDAGQLNLGQLIQQVVCFAVEAYVDWLWGLGPVGGRG
jgi:hypothetical protein